MSGGSGGGKAADFEKLVRDSHALVMDIDASGPVLQRNLAQLDAASRRLARAHPKASDPQSTASAQMYFARKGLDIGKQSRVLEKIDLSRVYEPSDLAVAELDLVKYLDHHQHLLMNTCIEEATKMTANAFRKHYIGKMDDDWERAKRDILERVGFRSGSKGLASAFATNSSNSALVAAGAAGGIGAASPGKLATPMGGRKPASAAANAAAAAAVNGTAVGGGVGGAAAVAGGRLMPVEQQRYANVIGVLNEKRALERVPFGLVTTMRETAKLIDDYNDKKGSDSDVVLTWELIREMIGEESVVNGVFVNPNGSAAAGTAAASAAASPNVLSERQFARDYARQTLALRNKLISGGRRFLQSEFKLYMDAVVSNAPPARREGSGTTGALNSVRTFLNAIYQRNASDNTPSTPWPNFQTDICDRYPFWAQLYFLYRSGQIKVMQEFVERVEQRANQKDLKTFASCLKLRAGSGTAGAADGAKELPAALHTELNAAYNKFFKTTRDPYKLVMYFIVGRFKGAEIDHARTYVATTVEDYFWLRLTTLWENEEPLPNWLLDDKKEAPQFSLAALQAENLELGEKHYNSDQRAPLRYFKVLLLSQQFEQAIAYIVRTDYFWTGVHVAIALDYYGLLRRAQPTQDLLVRSGSGVDYVNLFRIIRKYVEPFSRTHPLQAFHYLYVLRQSTNALALSGAGAGSGLFSTPSGKGASSLLSPSNADSKYGRVDDSADSSSQASNPKWNDQVFDAAVDLIVETKEYDVLIGTIRDNRGGAQLQKTGCVYRFFPAADASTIIVLAADRADASGWHSDAIRLFLLAEKFDRVASLCTKRVSRVVSAPSHHPERVEMLQLTRRFLEFLSTGQEHIKQTPKKATAAAAAAAAAYSPFGGAASSSSSSTAAATAASQAHAVSSEKLAALHALLKIAQFFDLYHLGADHFEDAIMVMEQLGLIPSNLSHDELELVVGRFARMDESVRRLLADISVACMEMFHAKYKAIKEQKLTARDPARQKILDAYREKAKAVVNFIGLHHSLVGAEVNSKLLRIESFMS